MNINLKLLLILVQNIMKLWHYKCDHRCCNIFIPQLRKRNLKKINSWPKFMESGSERTQGQHRPSVLLSSFYALNGHFLLYTMSRKRLRYIFKITHTCICPILSSKGLETLISPCVLNILPHAVIRAWQIKAIIVTITSYSSNLSCHLLNQKSSTSIEAKIRQTCLMEK